MEVQGELPSGVLIWQPNHGAYVATIAVKATFDLVPGVMPLSQVQAPIVEAEQHWDDDPSKSLSAAGDLAPAKLLCDVYLVGHAFAPQGRPVQQLIARLAFEEVDKSVELLVDRSLGQDGTVYQGTRWARMPLVYERTAGGGSSWNPAGVDKASRDAYGRSPLPNIVPPGRGEDPLLFPEPVGFGPIAAGWAPRTERLGYHPMVTPDFLRTKHLPDSLDRGFFNVAPRDQQVEVIPAAGRLRLENQHPQHPVLASTLPGFQVRVSYERRGSVERVAMRADTLCIDTDRSCVTLTWRGQVPLERRDEALRAHAEIQRPRDSSRTMQHDTTQDAEFRSEPAITRSASRTADPAAAAARALPFAQAGAPSPDRKSSFAALPFVGQGPASAPAGVDLSETLPGGQSSAGLPFASKPLPERPVAYPTNVAPQPSPWSAGGAAYPAAPQSAPFTGQVTPFSGQAAAAGPAFSAPSPQPAPIRVSGGVEAPAWASTVTGPQITGPQIQPPAAVGHASTAALGGLIGASNAAADPRSKGGRASGPRKIEGDVFQILWFDPDITARLRRKPEWKALLDKLEQGPFDPEVDEPGLADDPVELEDRREVFEILARGTPTGQDGVDLALLDAVRSDGRFAPQVLLLLGEAQFDFDEIELLKATISAATPFAANDEELKKVIDQTAQFLATPDLVSSPDISTSMTTRLKEAFFKVSRPVPATYLDDQAERALLARRAYQKRTVFGEPYLRSLFFFGDGTTGLPTYFPEVVAKRLPLYRRLKVRLLAEAHYQADQYESHSAAMKVTAVARVLSGG